MKRIDKLGLFNSPKYLKETPVGLYKTYKYTTEDCINQSLKERIPVLNISLDNIKEIKYELGILTVDGVSEDVSGMSLGDLSYLLKDKYSVNTNQIELKSNTLMNLPVPLLSPFNNIHSTLVQGYVSPYKLTTKSNKTIITIDSEILLLKALSEEGEENFKIDSGYVYFDISKNIKIFTKEVSKNFYIFIDFSPKNILNGEVVSNLMEYSNENA